jgi:type I restriction enzyme R subunit
VVAEDQIRTVVRTFRDRLFTEIFPGRTDVPKTLDLREGRQPRRRHRARVREEFGKGNDFCEKITYKTDTVRLVGKEIGPGGASARWSRYKSSGVKAEDLLSSFRNRL